MARPSKISSPPAPRSKARSPQGSPQTAKAKPKPSGRITKPQSKSLKAKQTKSQGRHLELVEADGAVTDSVPVPDDFNIKLKDLLNAGINFQKSDSLKGSPPTPQASLPTPHGMRRHNTAFCYRLGLLQALAHAPAFCTNLRASQKFCIVKGRKDNCLACALSRVMRSYWDHPDQLEEAVHHFHEVLLKTASPMPWYYPGRDEQADIQEFLLWLAATIPEQHPHDPLKTTLDVVLEGRWTCRHCARVHAKRDSDVCLSVGITAPRRGLDLASYIREYTTEEVEVRCDNPTCGTNEVRQRHKRFTTLPKVLFVQLKRFAFVRGRGGMRKIDSPVRFPEKLSLKEFAQEGMKGTRYELTAYVAHTGALTRGHYVSMVKGPEGIHEIDDHRVREKMDWYDGPRRFTPYLLVYVQK